MRLLPVAARINQGNIFLDGIDLLALPEFEMRDIRGGRIAMIFQEPQTSLNPVLTVGQQIGETLKRHKNMRGVEQRRRSIELLEYHASIRAIFFSMVSICLPCPSSKCVIFVVDALL